jgi:uncharacterized protein YndB with AHSA1/START domain
MTNQGLLGIIIEYKKNKPSTKFMDNGNLNCAEAQMLIRKPVTEVFEAFIDPVITKNFWFTKGSGKLQVNKKVIWEWEMYNVSTPVVAKEILQNEKILFEWDEDTKTVEFKFKALKDGSTFVTVTECGYDMTGDELLAVVKRSTGGFTTVLDGLKAFLEHNIKLNLVADKFPKEVFDNDALRNLYGNVVKESKTTR